MDCEGKHVHDFSQEWFYHVSLAYGVTNNIELSLSLPFRDLRSAFIDDARPAFIGSHDKDSAGIGDLEIGARWRWQKEPYELYLITEVDIPTVETHNRDRLRRRFESEFQPSSGGWSVTLGLGIAKQQGLWSSHFEALHTLKFEGERDYEYGDSTQIRLGGSYQLAGSEGQSSVVLLGDIIAQFKVTQ